MTLLLASSCSKKTDQPVEKIIARIGDRDISVYEFIRRAEYTIRPVYCRGNSYIDKKIVLNSLIAEKLYALEADTIMIHNEAFQDYIKGRREQAMRQVLFHTQAFQKIKVDSQEIKPVFRMAGREYDISFISFPDAETAERFGNDIRKNEIQFEDFFRYQGITDIPKRKIKLKPETHPDIFHALFTQPVSKGDVIGPLNPEANNYLFIRIDGWVDRPAVTDGQIRQRWADASEYVHNQKALIIWQAYKTQVMRGKNIEFNEKAFYPLSELFYQLYFKSPRVQQQELKQQLWEDQKTTVPQLFFDNVKNILDEPFYMVDGRTYTVRDFKKLYASHPLVFRKPAMSQSEFPEQFKLAVVDLVMDLYLSQNAYEMGLENSVLVKRNVSMWRDAMLAIMKKHQILEKKNLWQDFERDYLKTINSYLNAYTDSLQYKYQHMIEIDTDTFEEINITRIDMMVHQPNVPYPAIVPGFPLITTDNKLDYGRKMQKE